MESGYESSKSMLILKANAFRLTAAEVFLRHRGWNVFSTTDVKEALLKLVDGKFSYILISVDHPNTKIQVLPQLIFHKFSIPVMTFAETTSRTSYNALIASEADYKIYAPVTGPAIERCVTKYLRDQQTRNLLTTRPQANPFPARPRLPHFQEEKSKDPLAYPQALKEQPKPLPVFISGVKPQSGFGNVQTLGARPGSLGAVKRQSENLEYQQRRLSHKRKRSDALDTLIVRGTQKSLNSTVEVLDGYVQHKVENTTNSGCIVVESNRFSGYIVAAIGNDRKIEEVFLRNIKQMLFKFLKDHGEHLTEREIMNVKVKQVDFESWALEYADFIRKSVHQGNEVALAFFPRRPVFFELEDSYHQDMAKILLRDLRGDRAVEFDLFIHLINNDKYVLYTPKGGVFYQKQLNRLKQQGITHMHVPKKSTQAVAKYHAQNYLNELVDAFDQSNFTLEKSV